MLLWRLRRTKTRIIKSRALLPTCRNSQHPRGLWDRHTYFPPHEFEILGTDEHDVRLDESFHASAKESTTRFLGK